MTVSESLDGEAGRSWRESRRAAQVKGYAELYDLDLAEIIVDAGESAKSLDRPGLQRALSMLKAGEAEALLVVKLDRLTRSVVDLGTLVERYFAPDKAASLAWFSPKPIRRLASTGGEPTPSSRAATAFDSWNAQADGARHAPTPLGHGWTKPPSMARALQIARQEIRPRSDPVPSGSDVRAAPAPPPIPGGAAVAIHFGWRSSAPWEQPVLAPPRVGPPYASGR